LGLLAQQVAAPELVLALRGLLEDPQAFGDQVVGQPAAAAAMA
jgi:hypothetical protein